MLCWRALARCTFQMKRYTLNKRNKMTAGQTHAVWVLPKGYRPAVPFYLAHIRRFYHLARCCTIENIQPLFVYSCFSVIRMVYTICTGHTPCYAQQCDICSHTHRARVKSFSPMIFPGGLEMFVYNVVRLLVFCSLAGHMLPGEVVLRLLLM